MKSDYRIDQAEWKAVQPRKKVAALIKSAWMDVGLCELAGKLFPESLTDGQRAVISIQFLVNEITNGGLHQFFFNSSGNYSMEVLEGLVRVGAKPYADLFVKAAGLFPNAHVPADVQARRKLLEKIPAKKVQQVFDRIFWKLEEKPSTKLDRFILGYVEKRPIEFFKSCPQSLGQPKAPNPSLPMALTDYRTKRSQLGQKKGEKLHWALIESAWDPFWENSRADRGRGLVFLQKLTPGMRTLLIVDVFNKQILHMGGSYSGLFFLGPYLDILEEAYRSMKATAYFQLLSEFLSKFPVEIRSPDYRTQEVVRQLVPPDQMDTLCSAFDQRFKKLLKSKTHRIERFVEEYVKQQGRQFFVD